jgi:2-desacetyl-2-hydroxyethyl bacteriochlorophyllide A dehydrogenase
MRQAILEGKRKFVVRDIPEPVLDEDEVLIKVQFCGICGSDLITFIEGIPARYGHEYAGDIVELGKGVKGFEIGDRVTAESISSCGDCYWCRRGQINLCENFDTLWTQSACGFATYTKAKYHQLHKLPPEVSYEESALAEPTAVALHSVMLSGVGIGDVVAVLGLGPIGQLVARLVKLAGARAVYATEASQSRIELARGAVDEVININVAEPVNRILELTGGNGADLVFESAGAVSAAQQAMTMARKGGAIVIVGVCIHPVEILAGSIALRELTIRGSMVFSAGEFATALNLIADRKIDVAPLITSVMPLDDINEAFEKAVSGEGGKILIKP